MTRTGALADTRMVREDAGRLRRLFSLAATRAASAAGSVWAAAAAFATVLTWAALGPVLGFSPTWQLAINTGTTIVTFLMVFLLQHAQNRDTLALHVKLDELLAAVEGASNRLIEAEELDEEELRDLREREQRPQRDRGGREGRSAGQA